MAVTQNIHTGDGETTDFLFTFGYINEEDVKVYLDGTITTDYYFAQPELIRFTTPPPSNTEILIRRETNVTGAEALFFPGSSIRADDLNTNFDQILFVVQDLKNVVDDLEQKIKALT